MIIDFHTHTFPDKLAPAAIEKLQSMSHTHPFTDGTAGALEASMARAGIDYSVVLPVATSPRQVPHVNDASLRLNERGGETGVLSFGCMHPDFGGYREELARIADRGIKGVKLHPVYQGVDFDDPRFLRILDRAGELGLLVLIHAGLDVGFPGVVHGSPAMIRRAVEAVGPVKLVLAHMGGWRSWDEAEALLPDTGVYLDTSFALDAMTSNGDGYYKTTEDLALLSEEQFLRIIRLFGADRVLFGTDCPWGDQSADLARLRRLPLAPEELSAILGGNAQRLLGLGSENSPLPLTPGRVILGRREAEPWSTQPCVTSAGAMII